VEVADEAPLSPRVAARNGQPPAPEPTVEPKAWSPGREAPAPAERPEPPPAPRAVPASERPKDTGLFDVVWPDPKSAAAAAGEAGGREPRLEAEAPRPEPVAERRIEPQPERAVLKSGVIDGMAYTLYTDGSIEAELPQGTLSFASVDALRAHLERHGG
jgi:hypothetical protein